MITSLADLLDKAGIAHPFGRFETAGTITSIGTIIF
jgi:hypothetical protein